MFHFVSDEPRKDYRHYRKINIFTIFLDLPE